LRIFFRNQPISNKNCLWWTCLLTDRDEMSNLYRGPSIAAIYQVLVHLVIRFQRRKLFMNRPISNTNCLYSQPTEPLVYILYCIICMLMFHHACLSFSIKSLRNNLCIYGCYLNWQVCVIQVSVLTKHTSMMQNIYLGYIQ
jgi:hypothetical protein